MLHKENALFDCGYRRSIGTRFEMFLMNIVDNESNTKLPKQLLKEFIVYFKWILSDPKVGLNSFFPVVKVKAHEAFTYILASLKYWLCFINHFITT